MFNSLRRNNAREAFMRTSESVSWSLAAVSAILSVVLWRELRAERQLVADLRAQPERTTVVVGEANCPVQPAVAAAPPAECPVVAPGNAALAATTARIADGAQRQNALAGDPEFQRARLATARSNMRSRYPGLAIELGLSEKETDTLYTILAESQLRNEAELASRAGSGSLSESALLAEMSRLQREQAQQQKDAIVAQLGATRYAAFQEYEETGPARQRVANFTGMFQQMGAPLTTDQSKALTAVMVTEQRRNESQSLSMPVSSPVARAEREIESDRRIVAAAANFLSPQQASMLKSKFEELAEGKRASSLMQQRLTDSQPGATGGR
jgi:hypothetical protein